MPPNREVNEMTKSKRQFLGLLIFLFGFIARPVFAKVIFTGYADLRNVPHSESTILGSDTLLKILGVTARESESRNFTLDSLGLFATTTFNEKTDFLFDVTYKRIGAKTEETRLQYAFLHYHPSSRWEAKAGRITLPIGLYNENYFYPFERHPVTAPLYQSAIIGLPIADHGVLVGKTLDAGPMAFYGAGYLVNGYGPSGSSTDTFRAGLGVSDSLLIANNFGPTNSNDKFAYGGHFQLSFLKNRNIKTGFSSYHGAWSPDGKNDFTMLNAYVSVDVGPLGVLAEGLQTETENDKGVAGFFGVRDWESKGAFIEARYTFLIEDSRELTFFAGSEKTTAKGEGTGASGREKLTQHRTGLSWRFNPNVLFKAQFSYLEYQLPIQIGGTNNDIEIRQKQILMNMTLTY